ncbi:hypothetical protein [Virgibacillus sp. L01]
MYIGDDAEELERTKDLGIKWHIESEDDVEDYGGTYLISKVGLAMLLEVV